MSFNPTHSGIVHSLEKLLERKAPPPIYHIKRANMNMLLEKIGDDGWFQDKNEAFWQESDFQSINPLPSDTDSEPQESDQFLNWHRDIDWQAVYAASVHEDIPVELWNEHASVKRTFLGYKSGSETPYVGYAQGYLHDGAASYPNCKLLREADIARFRVLPDFDWKPVKHAANQLTAVASTTPYRQYYMHCFVSDVWVAAVDDGTTRVELSRGAFPRCQSAVRKDYKRFWEQTFNVQD